MQNKTKSKTYGKGPKLKESKTDWQSTRLEFLLGVGPSVFLGDLGGQDGVGQPFVYDIEPTLTRHSVSGGIRYYLTEHTSVRAIFSHAQVRGDDALTNYPNRRYRNVNFKSSIMELAGLYEFHILKPKILHMTGAGSTRIFNGNRLGVYAFGGLGGFYFNPKGQLGSAYYPLQPLNTEGQGFADGPKKYRRVSMSLPTGGGAFWLLNHNFTIGLDVGYRWTLTDYIDDVSGYFYDNEAIGERDGKIAAYFANPSVALSDVPDPEWYMEGQPRGGAKSNDTYIFTQVTLTKSFAPSISNKQFKNKKRKSTKTYNHKSKKLNKSSRAKNRTYKSGKKVKNKKRKFRAPNLQFGKKRKKYKINTF